MRPSASTMSANLALQNLVNPTVVQLELHALLSICLSIVKMSTQVLAMDTLLLQTAQMPLKTPLAKMDSALENLARLLTRSATVLVSVMAAR